VLLNLQSNALKFTREGKVTIRVELNPKDVSFKAVRVSVMDTGIGIPYAD